MLTPVPTGLLVESLGMGLSELKRHPAIPWNEVAALSSAIVFSRIGFLREAPAEIVKESWTSQGNDATSLVTETYTPHNPNDFVGTRDIVNRRDVHSCR